MQMGSHGQVSKAQKLYVPILPMQLLYFFSGSENAHK